MQQLYWEDIISTSQDEETEVSGGVFLLLFLLFSSLYVFKFILGGGNSQVPPHARVSQGNPWDLVFFSTTWVPEIKLRLSVLEASTCTC